MPLHFFCLTLLIFGIGLIEFKSNVNETRKKQNVNET